MKGPYQIGDKLLVYNNDGQRVFLDSSDINITCHMIEHGQWEPHVRKIMRHILKPGSCYIDVGANIGLHALYAGRLIGPSGKMLLFEPNRNTFNLLKLNMDVNGFRDIADCRMEAVSNLCGKKKFYAIENFSGMSGFMNQFREDKNLRFKKSTVRTVTLDDVAGELNPSLIKIDVEGFERDVILGAKKLLSRSPETTVLLEWTNPPLLGQKAQDDILDFLLDINVI